jgi:2-alkenal reductase
MNRLRRPLLTALLAVVISAPGGACSQAVAEPRAVTPRGQLPDVERAVIALFEATAPSVASITTQIVQRNGIFGAQQVAEGAGSGFVWDASGHVVTNDHVIQGASRVLVQLDAGDPIEARVIGRAPEYDLAVVRLSRPPSKLRPIPVGSSAELRIGQSVFAIGNPFGLQRTLTRGIVSALDRELPTAGFREVAGVIQTDAAINPGNSGGPLLDSAGRLIGVNSAIRSASGSSAGVGFAIPVDLVNRIVPLLISRGRAPLPGIGITPVRPDLVARAGIRGVVIGDIDRGSPAAEAGLKAMDPRANDLGDIIVAVNGRPINTLSNLVSELERAGVGSSAELTVRRGDKDRKVKVRVVDLRR